MRNATAESTKVVDVVDWVEKNYSARGRPPEVALPDAESLLCQIWT